MRRIVFTIVIFLIAPALVLAQLKVKDNPINIKNEIVKPAENYFLGLSFIDLSKIEMSHSYSISYASIGGNGVSQSLYLNTLKYQISAPLSLSVQWGVRSYPYNSFGNDHPAFRSGLFFSGAELKYRPSDKFYMKFRVDTQPLTNYYGYPYRYRNTGFLDDEE